MLQRRSSFFESMRNSQFDWSTGQYHLLAAILILVVPATSRRRCRSPIRATTEFSAVVGEDRLYGSPVFVRWAVVVE